jgi:RTX calcium-binding nonapeptide repeat (4 copies)
LATLAIVACVAPQAAAADPPGATASVWTVHGSRASAATSLNVLTLMDQRRIDNRISAYVGPTGRLVLTAPEGLGDPDGSGPNCSLDNAKPTEASSTEVSCAPGYIGAIVGDLGGGSDTFDADPGLSVYVGAVIDGTRQPLGGGRGRDRLVGGALADLLDGAGGSDSIVGGGGEDFLIGGPGADNLSGGGGSDVLVGLGGSDKLNGGAGRDLCRGGGGFDIGKSCDVLRGIP